MEIGNFRISNGDFVCFFRSEKWVGENFCDFLGSWMLMSVLTEDSKKGRKKVPIKKKKKKKKHPLNGFIWAVSVHEWLLSVEQQ